MIRTFTRPIFTTLVAAFYIFNYGVTVYWYTRKRFISQFIFKTNWLPFLEERGRCLECSQKDGHACFLNVFWDRKQTTIISKRVRCTTFDVIYPSLSADFSSFCWRRFCVPVLNHRPRIFLPTFLHFSELLLADDSKRLSQGDVKSVSSQGLPYLSHLRFFGFGAIILN